MLKIQEVPTEGYELVVEVTDDAVDLHGFIAVHNSSLGPALGGVRLYAYPTKQDALTDVLRLSKGMTYKSAMAGIGLGGGKSVIIGDPKRNKTEALLLAFGKAVDQLGGRYICAEDVGTTTEDMSIINRSTPYVTALASDQSSGDPSPFTAWGVYRGLQALALALWGNPELKGRTIAVQGIGKVGGRLADLLFWHGAKLIISDTDTQRAAHLARRLGARNVAPTAIYGVECDLFSPCALGGILNDQTIPELKCKGIGGSANNQLLTPEQGALLLKKSILYAPDYIINAGGVINVASELDPNGYNPASARDKVDAIFDTLTDIFHLAKAEGLPTNVIADRLAEQKLSTGSGRRHSPIPWETRKR